MPDTVDVPWKSIARVWTDAWAAPRFRREVVLTAVAFIGVLNAMARFLNWVELRPGVVLPDPVLAAISPRDVTWVTFALVYAGILTTVVVLLPSPRRLLLGLQSYAVMVLLRMVVMSVTPLEAPPAMIPLQDPLVQVLGTGQTLTRDLFFSGHTSTLFLLTLMVPGRRLRALFLACTIAVGGCVLWQHVHYTVDVLVAPFFAFAARALAVRLHGRARPG
ncbi:MAG TPA: phosphatase PAP2-related protein [Myxococcaceae bacterium]|nr:phosphatase PAP2-related protein [Myxococcaceae bacterium]